MRKTHRVVITGRLLLLPKTAQTDHYKGKEEELLDSAREKYLKAPPQVDDEAQSESVPVVQQQKRVFSDFFS
jgi:hypothetical protein